MNRKRRGAFGLTERERRFVEEFVKDFDGGAAARRAGYTGTDGSCSTQASRMLGRLDVSAAVEDMMIKSGGITRARVMAEIGRVAFSNLDDILEWDEDGVRVRPSANLTREQKAAIASVTETITANGNSIKVSMHSKMDALEKLGKIFRMMPDRMELSGPDGGPVQVSATDALRERLDKLKVVDAVAVRR